MLIYPFLFQKLIFPIAMILKRMPIQKYLNEMEEQEQWTLEQIKKLQIQKLKSLITHCYNTVPYYHELFKKQGLKPSDIKTLEDLKQIPLLTKETIKKRFSDLISKDFDERKLIKDFSSGSTGEPLKFLYSKKENALKWASFYRGWKWAGYDFGMKVFIVWGNYAALANQSDWLAKLKNFLMRTKSFNAFNLRKELIPLCIKRIIDYRPHIIYGYTSALYLLAKYMHEDNIYLSHIKTIITTSETLHQTWRELIQKHFNCKLYDNYGIEGIVVAQECDKGNLHINADNCIVEFLPINGNRFKKIVVTNLNNYAMPFIRYDTKDIGLPSKKKCPCGRGLPVMDAIEGRIPDILITPNGKYLTHNFFVFFFESIEEVEQFQIIQNKLDEIVVKIVVRKNFKLKTFNYIRDVIQKQVGPDVKLKIKIVPYIPPAKSGKRRFVISTYMERREKNA